MIPRHSLVKLDIWIYKNETILHILFYFFLEICLLMLTWTVLAAHFTGSSSDSCSCVSGSSSLSSININSTDSGSSSNSSSDGSSFPILVDRRLVLLKLNQLWFMLFHINHSWTPQKNNSINRFF